MTHLGPRVPLCGAKGECVPLERVTCMACLDARLEQLKKAVKRDR